MRATKVLVVAAVLAAAVAVRPAAAEDGWKYTIAPYMMGAAMDGWIQVRGKAAEVNVPFDQIWSNLHFGAMVHFDMKNDRWLISSDLTYMDLRQDAEVRTGTGQAQVKETLFEATGGYRVSPGVALLAGARLVDLSAKLSFTGANANVSGDQSKSWVDPLVGVQLTLTFSERWWLDARLDAGGFGVGSKQAWHEYANLYYRPSDHVSVFVGYQALDMEYQTGSGSNLFRYDVLSSGPQVGVAFHF